MEIHERIRELRKNHLCLSQEQFGSRLGVSRSVINNIERNVLARPEQKEPLIRLICKEFGISELWLREGIGDMEETISGDNQFSWSIGKLMNTTSPTVMNMVNAIAETDPEKLEIIVEFMKKCLGL